MNRSIRLLNLLQLLREYRYLVTAQVLVERLQGASVVFAVILKPGGRRGAEIEAVAGLGFQLKEDFLLPPMILNENEAMFLALYWLKSIPDQALNEASISVLAKLNAVLPEHRQNLLQQTTLRAFNVWLPVNQILVEQVRVSIRSQVKIFFDYVDEQQRTSARTV